MTITTKRKKGIDYLYDVYWSPEEKRQKSHYLGRADSIPEPVLTDDHKETPSEFMKALEKANIDQALVFLVMESNNSILEMSREQELPCDPNQLQLLEDVIKYMNKSIELYGVPPHIVELMHDLIEKWKVQSPAIHPTFSPDEMTEPVPCPIHGVSLGVHK